MAEATPHHWTRPSSPRSHTGPSEIQEQWLCINGCICRVQLPMHAQKPCAVTAPEFTQAGVEGGGEKAEFSSGWTVPGCGRAICMWWVPRAPQPPVKDCWRGKLGGQTAFTPAGGIPQWHHLGTQVNHLKSTSVHTMAVWYHLRHRAVT